MKHLLKIILIVFLAICLIEILRSCRKIKESEVTTLNPTEATATSALSGANVINNSGDEMTAQGVCWSTA